MSSTKRTAFPLLIWFLLLLFSPGCSDRTDTRAPQGLFGRNMEESKESQALIPVRVETAKREDVYDYILSNSTIEPSREIEIVARASGEVMEINVDVSGEVERGLLLALLDDSEIRLNLDEAGINLKKAQRNFDRAKKMHGDDLISSEDFEGAQISLDTARNTVDQMKLQLEYTRIRSPIAGVVTFRGIDVGDHVSAGTTLFRIVDMDALYAKVYVPEAEYPLIRKGQEVLTEVEALGDEIFFGAIDRMNPAIDPVSGTIEVRVKIEDPEKKLLPGMFATFKIVTVKRERALTIPKQSLLLESGESEIFLVEDDKARLVAVRKGIERGERVEILGGVDDDDLVVVAGQESLRDGIPVRIVAGEDRPPSDTERESLMAERRGPPGGRRFGNPGEMLEDESFIKSPRFEAFFERVMNNPSVREEYERSVKEDPSLATDPLKKAELLKKVFSQMHR